MRRLRHFTCAAAFAVAATTTSIGARADDAAAAQALFDQAKVAMAAHKYSEACPKLEESFRLQEALGTLLNLADCYEQDGRFASAWSKFLEAAARARAAGQTQRARVGHDRAAALVPKLSNLIIDVPSANRVDGLEIRRDSTVAGEAEWGTPIPADAGTHVVTASAPGKKPWSETVTILKGATTARVTIPALESLPVASIPTPTPTEPAASPGPLQTPAPATGESRNPGATSRVVAITVGALGLVGVGVGATFGVLSMGKHNDAQTACPNQCRTGEGVSLWQDAVTFGNVSTVGFVAGGAALAASVVLWLTAPSAPETPAAPASARLVFGPGTIGLNGQF